MFGFHGMGRMVPTIKSDIQTVRRMNNGSTSATHMNGFDFDLIGSIKHVFARDTDIDHAVIQIYTEMEDWYDDMQGWGMC